MAAREYYDYLYEKIKLIFPKAKMVQKEYPELTSVFIVVVGDVEYRKSAPKYITDKYSQMFGRKDIFWETKDLDAIEIVKSISGAIIYGSSED